MYNRTSSSPLHPTFAHHSTNPDQQSSTLNQWHTCLNLRRTQMSLSPSFSSINTSSAPFPFLAKQNSHLPQTEIFSTDFVYLASAGSSSSEMLSIFGPGKHVSTRINSLVSEEGSLKKDERLGAESRSANAMKTSIEGAMQVVAFKPRLSYNNGYGDFCFGRITTWNKKYERSSFGGEPAIEFAEENLIAGSNNIPVQEPGSFQRSEPFQFFKLPIEVREHIYRLILEPFYQADDHTMINIYIGQSRAHMPRSYAYEGDFDAYLLRQAWNEAKQHSESGKQTELKIGVLSPEERLEKETQYNEAKKACAHEQQEHPARSLQYTMDAYPRKKRESPKLYSGKDWLIIQHVRHHSNVNTELRKELGDVFWRRITVDCQEDVETEELLQFLKERPALHQGLMGLDIAVNVDVYEMNEEYPEASRHFCDSVVGMLKLETFHITLSVFEHELLDLVEGRGRLQFLLNMRSLQVTKTFNMDFRVTLTTIDSEDSDHAMDDRRDELEQEWNSKIEELLMPDTMRSKELSTEAEKVPSFTAMPAPVRLDSANLRILATVSSSGGRTSSFLPPQKVGQRSVAV